MRQTYQVIQTKSYPIGDERAVIATFTSLKKAIAERNGLEKQEWATWIHYTVETKKEEGSGIDTRKQIQEEKDWRLKLTGSRSILITMSRF